MKLNYQQFYQDLQDKLIDLYETDPTKAKILKEILNELKEQQRPPVFCNDYS